MSAIITSHNGYLQEKPLQTYRLFISNNYRTNKYTIDNMYHVSFSYKLIEDPSIIKVLRYHSPNNILFINFEFDPKQHAWNKVYNHFMKHYDEFELLQKKKYIHEVFQNNTPTRMFFDLDFKNVSKKTIDSYIQTLVQKVSLYTGKQLEYVITKNNNEDLSRHLIFTNLILPDIQQCKLLAQHFKDDYIDLQPYRNNASLRVLNGIKVMGVGAYKTKVFDQSNYIIPSDETYLIQPDITQLDITHLNKPQPIINQFACTDDQIAGIDLSEYGLIIHSKIGDTNLYALRRISQVNCPICERLHDKEDSNYLIVNHLNVKLRCYRQEGFIRIKSNKFKLIEFLQKIDATKYDNLESELSSVTKYNKPDAELPKSIEGNLLYLVSPCKTSKTKLIHELITREEYRNKSICFITNQTKFTRNLSERFKDLDFSCYLDSTFDPNHNRIIISLYSLHRIKTLQYDVIILDEVESILVNFCSIGILGNKDVRKSNLNKYTQLINNSPLCIVMDAYPTRYTIDHFNIFGKKIHLHINEYKTHANDTMILIESMNMFIAAMAKSLSKGENIVFASALKDKQLDIINKVYAILNQLYNIDPMTLESRVYNSSLDNNLMDESIRNIDSDWFVNLLAYSPSITAGISFEQTHFDKVFYLGYPNSTHISALQALYRVRDISTHKYYITFARSYSVKSQIYDKNEINYLSSFNKQNLLDYDIIHNEFNCEITLANSISNKLLHNSDQYMMDSQRNYYKYLIGQFKYNESQIKFKTIDDLKPVNFNKIDSDDVTNFLQNKKMLPKFDNICESHLSKVALRPEDYIKLPDDEFERLNNKINKTLQEKAIVEINTYLRMFPKFDQSNHQTVASHPSTYYKYYNTYTKYHKYVNEKIETFVNFKKNKSDPLGINEEPLNRFKTQVVSKFLQRLLIDDTLSYKELHDAEYKDISVDEIIEALHYIQSHILKDDKIYINVFMREFYTNDLLKNKVPIHNITTWKQARGVVNNMIEGAFNLRSKTKRKGKDNAFVVSFVRQITLF